MYFCILKGYFFCYETKICLFVFYVYSPINKKRNSLLALSALGCEMLSLINLKNYYGLKVFFLHEWVISCWKRIVWGAPWFETSQSPAKINSKALFHIHEENNKHSFVHLFICTGNKYLKNKYNNPFNWTKCSVLLLP